MADLSGNNHPKNNRYMLPLVVAVFLILEALLFGLDRIYLEKKISEGQSNLPANERNPSALLATLRFQALELTWDHGQQKKDIPLIELLVPFKRRYTGQDSWRVDREKLLALLTPLAIEIDRVPVNAKLEYSEAGKRIKEFALPQTGLKLDLNQSVAQIIRGLINGQLIIPLTITETQPDITAQAVEKLGITALLGKGESNFDGSSSSRIVNIKIGSTKFHGLLVKPGEEFSFNDNLGEVEATTGYQPELVIKNNRLVWEYGGGLCQVSTTLFRAAIYAGLPILERRPHSFPVRYYNPQGFDATIYPNLVDFRFKNNTPRSILIQTKITGKKLAFEIYGSADGRQVFLDGPYQYDQQANGAMKAYFTRKIRSADGLEKIEKFSSNYRPPPASPQEKNPLE